MLATMECVIVREHEKPSANVRIKQLCGFNNYSHLFSVSFLCFGNACRVVFETSPFRNEFFVLLTIRILISKYNTGATVSGFNSNLSAFCH